MIELEVKYETPPFRGDLDVPTMTAIQSGRRVTIQPRTVSITVRDGEIRAYVQGRSLGQKTGQPGQSRAIVWGLNSGREHDDTMPTHNAPAWLLELMDRAALYEHKRTDAETNHG